MKEFNLFGYFAGKEAQRATALRKNVRSKAERALGVVSSPGGIARLALAATHSGSFASSTLQTTKQNAHCS